jgi:hypothetical protein
MRLADVEERLQAAAAEADAHRERLTAAQAELARLTAFWHYFRRRRQQRALESLRQGLSVADSAVGELHAEKSAILAEAAPEFAGISLGARRNINLAIISYAESLCDHVDEFALAARAKEAVARRVHEMTFGTRAECEDFMQRVQKAQAVIANHRQITAAVRGKLERLRATSDYRNLADTVPTADSLSAASAGSQNQWNVLAEDYWDLYNLLLR